MPSRIVVEKLCDLCFADQKEVDSVEVIASPFGDKAMLCCLDHGEKVRMVIQEVQGLFAFASEEAPPVKKKPASKRAAGQVGEKKFFCTYKTCPYAGAVSTGALIQHGRVAHQLSMEDMRKKGWPV